MTGARVELHSTELEAFYRGDRALLTRIYRDTVAQVERRVFRYCHGADAESVVQETYLRIVEREEVRRSFTGGNLAAWLGTMAKNRAIDFVKRHGRLRFYSEARALENELEAVDVERALLDRDELQALLRALDAFERDVLPGLGEDAARLYALRVRPERISQLDAARRLGIKRTTLIGREQRLMQRLARFVAAKLDLSRGGDGAAKRSAADATTALLAAAGEVTR
ncbi:MAG: sigma-70 family RNA polymerase sigma factor [Myxococcales bacterium]|nr:sigma-70 family RNA polymerase sigma factor [Myxococcales bacterium]